MATIHEIAKKAGVSPALVSLALNGKPRVNPQTAEKIIRIAAELGYRQNSAKNSRPGNLRFLRLTKGDNFLRDSHSTFFAEYFDGAERFLNSRGYRTEVASYTGENLANAVRDLNGLPVQGAIVLATELVPADMDAFASSPVPLVFLDTCHDFLPHDYCTMNNLDAVDLAVQHLYNMGHRAVGMVASQVESGNFADRLAAFRRALALRGIRHTQSAHYEAMPETAPAAERLLREFRRRRPPPALFCSTDNLAYACMRALGELGLRVPEDVSLVGFDDLPPSAVTQPPLTSISVPTRAMGMAAARLLTDRIADPDRPCEKVRLGCKLVMRESVIKR